MLTVPLKLAKVPVFALSTWWAIPFLSVLKGCSKLVASIGTPIMSLFQQRCWPKPSEPWRDGWRLNVFGRVKNLGSCGQGIKNALKMTGEYDGPLTLTKEYRFAFFRCG